MYYHLWLVAWVMLLAAPRTAADCDFDTSTTLTAGINCTSLSIPAGVTVTFFDAAAPYGSFNVCVSGIADIHGTLVFGSAGMSMFVVNSLRMQENSRVFFKQLTLAAHDITIWAGAKFDGSGSITIDDATALGLVGTTGQCIPGGTQGLSCGGRGGYHYYAGGLGNNMIAHAGLQGTTYDVLLLPRLPGSPGGRGRNGTMNAFDDTKYGNGGGALFLQTQSLDIHSTTPAFDVSGADTENAGGGAGGTINAKVQGTCVELGNSAAMFLADGGNAVLGGGGSGGIIQFHYEYYLGSGCSIPTGQAARGSGDQEGCAGYVNVDCHNYNSPPLMCSAQNTDTTGATSASSLPPPSTTTSSTTGSTTGGSASSSSTTSGGSGASSSSTTASTIGQNGPQTSTTGAGSGATATASTASAGTATGQSSSETTHSTTGAGGEGEITSPPSDDVSSSSTAGIVAAVIVIVILLPILILAIIIFIMKRRRRGSKQPSPSSDKPLPRADSKSMPRTASNAKLVGSAQSVEMTAISTLQPTTTDNPAFVASNTSSSASNTFLDSKVSLGSFAPEGTLQLPPSQTADPATTVAKLSTAEEDTRMLALQSSARVYYFSEENTMVSDLTSLGKSRTESASIPDVRGDDMTTHYSLRNTGRAAQVKEMLDAPSTKLLGSGLTADVFSVKYGKGQTVAVKKFKADNTSAQAEFHAEVAALSRVANRSHPHVLGLVFICAEPSALAIVVEMAEGGSLVSVLTGQLKLSDKARRATVGGIASGMAFLHLSGVIHLDLKPANVLRTKAGVVKIADFGTSVLINGSDEITTGAFVGTPRYSAPERLIAGKPIQLKPTDVYSFGLTMWAIYACQAPPADGDDVSALASSRSREDSTMPRAWSDEGTDIHALVLRCCAADPTKRPTFEDIVTTLSKN